MRTVFGQNPEARSWVRVTDYRVTGRMTFRHRDTQTDRQTASITTPPLLSNNDGDHDDWWWWSSWWWSVLVTASVWEQHISSQTTYAEIPRYLLNIGCQISCRSVNHPVHPSMFSIFRPTLLTDRQTAAPYNEEINTDAADVTWLRKQKAQLSQRDSSTLCVSLSYARSLKVIRNDNWVGHV